MSNTKDLKVRVETLEAELAKVKRELNQQTAEEYAIALFRCPQSDDGHHKNLKATGYSYTLDRYTTYHSVEASAVSYEPESGEGLFVVRTPYSLDKVRKALDEAGYEEWLRSDIEGSRWHWKHVLYVSPKVVK